MRGPHLNQGKFAPAALAGILLLARTAFPQTSPDPPGLPLILPLKLELSQCLSPFGGRSLLVTDRFHLAAEGKSLSLQFSSRAPSLFEGKQFAILPSGYRLAGISLRRQAVSLSAFRSVGTDSGAARQHKAETVAFLGIETARAPLGARIGAYFLRATAPAQHLADGAGAARGAQMGLEVAADLRRGLELKSEWSRSFRDSLAPQPGRAQPDAWYLTLTSRESIVDAALTVRIRGGGFINPTVSLRPDAIRMINAALQRKFKGHHLVYSSQLNSWGAGFGARTGPPRAHRESISWSYTFRRLPRIAAAKSWLAEKNQNGFETEEILTLSAGKRWKPVQFDIGYVEADRSNSLLPERMMSRTGSLADAVIDLPWNQRLEIHGERILLRTGRNPDLLRTDRLDIRTRLTTPGGVVLAPSVDFRSLGCPHAHSHHSFLDVTLSAQIRMPRRLAGVDLHLLFSNRRRLSNPGSHPSSTEFAVRWSFKKG